MATETNGSLNAIGTYLKVVRFADPSNPDGFIVLYLRPRGLFLLLGYWSGHEQSAVAGRWTKDGDLVRLKGRGRTSTDAPPDTSGSFAREFKTVLLNHTPALVADDTIAGWSLPGWAGHYVYVGQATVINPDGAWLPQSLTEVDVQIAECR